MNSTDERRRRFRITIRVSPKERETLDQEAARCGITLSAYARNALLEAKPLRSARRPSVETALLVSVLDRLGTLASAIRAISLLFSVKSGVELPSIERDLLRSLTELRALRPVLLQALGKRGRAT
jgi:hypothetical protein